MCFPCWKRGADEKAAREAEMLAELESARRCQIPPERLRGLIQLCHPDKHNGSETATEVTAWLLSIRKAGQR